MNMESGYPRKNAATILPIAVFVLSLAIISCGGGGGGGGSTGLTGGSTNATGSTSGGDGPLGCSLDLHVPNYDRDTDPSTSEPNQLHWWDHFPLKVYFSSEPTIAGQNAADLAMAGFEGWNTPAGANLVEKVNSASGADVVIDFQHQAPPPGGGDVLGQTGWSYNPQTFQVSSATISLLTWDNMSSAEANGFRRTAMHEYGHVLFLGGHSEVTADVMFPSGPADQFTPLTTRDNNSLKTAYCDSVADRSRSRARYTGPLAHKTIN
jgi:hypothetical protein